MSGARIHGFREGENPDGTPIPGFKPVENKQTEKKGGARFFGVFRGRKIKSSGNLFKPIKSGKTGAGPIESPLMRAAVMPNV
jgi:hypothetical protein